MFTIAKPFSSVSQSRFGGLYTEVDARDLPNGASPLCHDNDFQIGQVTVRPSLALNAITANSSAFGIFQMVKELLIKGSLVEGSSLYLAKVCRIPQAISGAKRSRHREPTTRSMRGLSITPGCWWKTSASAVSCRFRTLLKAKISPCNGTA